MNDNLGEAGAPHDDVSYAGADPAASALSLDYYREKVREFQTTLTALDAGYAAAENALVNLPLDPETQQGLSDWINEYQGKRWTLKATAEAINMGAAAINAAGGRMPVLSLPQTLGIAPAIPVAAIVATATAATLILWGRDALKILRDYLARAQLLDTATPEQRQELARAMTEADSAVRIAESSGVAALAPVLKWGAIAIGAYLAWKALAPMISARRGNPRDED